MRNKRVTAVALSMLVCLSVGGICTYAAPTENENEVHLVRIASGFEETGGIIHGPRALVHVDRPGKKVTLVLTSIRKVKWHVSFTKKTEIRQVILSGLEQQAVEGVPESTEIKREKIEAVYYTFYPADGPSMQRLVRQVYKITERELASAHSVESPQSACRL